MRQREELEEKQKALKYSIIEGSATSASTGLGDSIITPFALQIVPESISNIFIGLLSSFSLLLSQILQKPGTRLIKKHPRKSIVLFTVAIQATMWLAIGSLAILIAFSIITGWLPILLVIFYSGIAILTGLHYPAWFSWMGDLVPDDERGRYFSKRNLIIGIIALATALLAGFLLKTFKEHDYLLLGFSILFFLAFVFRMISKFYLNKQYAPPGGYKKEELISYKEFKKNYKNFYKFSIYQAFFNFAIYIASPFFAVYMLQDLKFDYATYMIVSVSSTAFYLLFLTPIGKFSDKYGNLKLLYLANLAFVFSPVAWMFTRNPIILIIIPQIISGIANATLTIAVTNFTYASIPAHYRASSISYHSILVGIGIFLGSIIGGLVLNYIPIAFMNKFLFIFLIAAILRFVVGIFFLPQLKEARLAMHIKPLHMHISAPFKFVNASLHSITATGQKSFSQGLKVWNSV